MIFSEPGPMTPTPDTFNADLLACLPALRAFAWKLTRDKERLQDLVQDTALRALEKRHQFQPDALKPETSMTRWLYTIMYSRFADEIRAMRRRGPVLDVADFEQPVPPRQDGPLLMRDLGRCLDGMSEKLRSAVLMAADGAQHDQIAAVTNIPIGTVRSRLFRGREALRAAMG